MCSAKGTVPGASQMACRIVETCCVSDPSTASFVTDQLVISLVLSGGGFRIPSVTAHIRTNPDLPNTFGKDMRCQRQTNSALVLETFQIQWFPQCGVASSDRLANPTVFCVGHRSPSGEPQT